MVFFLLGGSLAPQWRVAQEIEVAAVIRLQDLLLIERGVASARRLTGDHRASRELLVAHEKIGAAIPHGHDTFLAGQGVLARTGDGIGEGFDRKHSATYKPPEIF